MKRPRVMAAAAATAVLILFPGASALIGGGRGGLPGLPGLPSPFVKQPPKLGTTVPDPRGTLPFRTTEEQLVQRLVSKLPIDSKVDSATASWFLRDRYLDVEKARAKIIARTRWRRSFEDSARQADTAREASTGKGYLHSARDVLNRPVVVAVARRHSLRTRKLIESKKLCVEVFEAALSQLEGVTDSSHGLLRGESERGGGSGISSGSGGGGESDTGGSSGGGGSGSSSGGAAKVASVGGTSGSAAPSVQQILGVFDLRELSADNLDFEFVTFLIDTIYRYYPLRLGQVLLVEATGIFSTAWPVIRPALGKHGSLVRFISADELRKEYFTPETVPDEFR